VSDQDRRYFAASREEEDQIGIIDDRRSTFGKTYVGEPEELAQQLAYDSAIEAADTLLLTIPNTLGVEYNAHILESIVKDVAPLLGWR
jgi:alkanesulfonate monooxygenase SsuD/methylene tetrahydromethanopterin reductase-like flavin-dependent oxidoreductase (luciferase family)